MQNNFRNLFNFKMNSIINNIIDFGRSIGLPIHTQSIIFSDSFLPHILIQRGEIYVNPELVSVSNLLHECGHLGLIPSKYKNVFSGNLYSGFANYLSQPTEIDSIQYYLMQAADDSGATAWAWAAGTFLNIPEVEIIENSSYDHSGEYIRNELRSGWHSGISGLNYANYTSKGNLKLLQTVTDKKVFPEMDFWTADEVLSHHGVDSMAFS